MVKFLSRKFLVTIFYGLIAFLDKKYGLSLPLTEMGAVAGTYILGESATDLIKRDKK